MTVITSTSGRLHSEFVSLLFLQTHRETDRLFTTSGDQLAQSSSVQFHYRHTVFSSQLKSNVGNTLTKAATLWVTPNIHGTPISSKSHTHPSHSQFLSHKPLVY